MKNIIIERNKDIDKKIMLGKVNNETEVFNVKKIGKNIGKQIVQARLNKNWNQKQLAQALNEHVSIVINYENGTAVYDSNKLQKFQRILKVKFDK